MTDTAAVSESLIYGVDVALAVALGVVAILGVMRMLHVGGWVFYKAGSVVGRFFYGIIEFFSKLYQAALGLSFAIIILVAVYFYLTTHEQRTHVHATLEKVTPTTAQLVRQALDTNTTQLGDAAAMAYWHLKNLTGQFIQAQ